MRHKTTLNSGFLYPIFCDEVLPGDTLSLRLGTFLRMATPLHPVMDSVFADIFFFFVPNRIVWENFQRMMGEQDKPGDSTDFVVPSVTPPAGGWLLGELACHFGLPILVDSGPVQSLPFRAYNKCVNDWFRDENLVDPAPVPTDDGPDDPSEFKLLRRGKRHDYITSCLPFAQKGQAVELPLGTSAPVTITGDGTPSFDTNAGTGGPGNMRVSELDGGVSIQNVSAGAGPNEDDATWVNPALIGDVDLSNATAATINQLRESFQIQRLFERDARGGSRYVELLRSHFGIMNYPDARLQRAEFLGSARTTLSTHVVPTTASAPPPKNTIGSLGAFVTGSTQGRVFTKSFVEHGHVIGLISIRADLTWQQKTHRMWKRGLLGRFDYYWPAFAHLGEQQVYNHEVLTLGDAADDEVWGYQERFAEYRYGDSMVTGSFRSDAPQSLDTWHLAVDFGGQRPALNETFILEHPPIDRVIAVQDEDEFLLDCVFDIVNARPMPTYSVPGMIDHF